MDEKDVKQADAAFSTLCKTLDEKGWHYEKESERTLLCGARGADLPIDIHITADAERKLVILMSPMPFEVPTDRRDATAVAVSAANYGMVDGNFDYDYKNGIISFRMTSSFRDSLIGKELFEYMLYVACHTIDRYNDRFLAVCAGDMSADEILDFVDGEDDRS